MQNNSFISQEIYAFITQLLSSSSNKKIVDLYAGVGITSLMLAKHGHFVHSVEINPASHELAKKNAEKNQIQNVKMWLSSAEKVSSSEFFKEISPEALLMNPPRTGIAPQVLGAVINSSCQEMVYISCMPSTLARDLSTLLSNGFSICDMRLFDMFPQTTHVETVVYLKRN